MADNSRIEWTDASWNPIRARNLKTGKVGWHCEHVTTGCEFCYSEGFNRRLGTGLPFKPGHRKDIELFLDQKMLTAPLRWRKPRKIFVCSMTDAFADFVKDGWLDWMFAIMTIARWHTFQVLSKRAERMRDYCSSNETMGRVLAIVNELVQKDGHTTLDHIPDGLAGFVLPNVWLGVSCERQQEADERIPWLLQTPAAVHFVSAEPLLGPIDFIRCLNGDQTYGSALLGRYRDHMPGEERHGDYLDWIIVGGESGPHARPMHPQWARDIRDQCVAAGVAFFFKQWGEWAHEGQYNANGKLIIWPADCEGANKIGKKAAGRLLDGRTWDEFPTPHRAERAA